MCALLPLQRHRVSRGHARGLEAPRRPVNVNYRYVEEELRYLLDDSDAKAVVFHAGVRAEARDDPRPSCRSSRRTSRSTTTVDDEASATAATRGTRSATKPRWPARAGGATSGRAPATTSTSSTPAAPPACPKGVMWRAEDIFFGGFGGGNLGEDPISKPEEIVDLLDASRRTAAARVSAHARHRALDGVRHPLHRRHGDHLPRSAASTRRDSGSSSRASTSTSS